MEIIEYLVERGSDTEFEFNWDNNFNLINHGDTKGTSMDYILAILERLNQKVNRHIAEIRLG